MTRLHPAHIASSVEPLEKYGRPFTAADVSLAVMNFNGAEPAS